jgi:uroporphyrinogen-III synthase
MAEPGVLVTRPAGQGDALCAALRSAGYAAYSQPLLALEGLGAPPARDRALVAELDRIDHVIFVSGNAVRYGLAWIEAQWPVLPAGPAWYAVGEATAGLLRSRGLEVLTPDEEISSDGLLALPPLAAVAGQRVLIVKGEGGRDTLREVLSRRGATVDELACYRRACPLLAPGELAARLRQWRIGTLLISSGEGLANLLALLDATETIKFSALNIIVPSARVAQAAREAGFHQIVTADNASDGAMLRALANCAVSPASGESDE